MDFLVQACSSRVKDDFAAYWFNIVSIIFMSKQVIDLNLESALGKASKISTNQSVALNLRLLI